MIRFFFKPMSKAADKFFSISKEYNDEIMAALEVNKNIPPRVFVDSTWGNNLLKPEDVVDIDFVFVNGTDLEKAKRHILPDCQSYLKNRYFFGQDALRIASDYISNQALYF